MSIKKPFLLWKQNQKKIWEMNKWVITLVVHLSSSFDFISLKENVIGCSFSCKFAYDIILVWNFLFFYFERLVCMGAMYLFLMHFKANKQAWSNELHRKIIKDVKSEWNKMMGEDIK